MFTEHLLQATPATATMASLTARLVKNSPAGQEALVHSWVGKIPWSRDRRPTPVFFSFPCGSAGKESASNAGDWGSILGLGGSPGEGKGYLLQYSRLENSMDYTVHGVTKTQTQLSDFHFHYSQSARCSLQGKYINKIMRPTPQRT